VEDQEDVTMPYYVRICISHGLHGAFRRLWVWVWATVWVGFGAVLVDVVYIGQYRISSFEQVVRGRLL
jgi:hypothetical protein